MPDEPILPDPLLKRDLLYSPEKPKGRDFAALGDAYLDSGRHSEALAFFLRAEDLDRVRTLKARAIEQGDASLLIAVSDALGDEVKPSDWTALAGAAMRQEKFTAAAEAYERAGKEEEAAAAREKFAALRESIAPLTPIGEPGEAPERGRSEGGSGGTGGAREAADDVGGGDFDGGGGGD